MIIFLSFLLGSVTGILIGYKFGYKRGRDFGIHYTIMILNRVGWTSGQKELIEKYLSFKGNKND